MSRERKSLHATPVASHRAHAHTGLGTTLNNECPAEDVLSVSHHCIIAPIIALSNCCNMALRETAAQSLKAGNTAVVTGGASGIGAAIVNILLEKGLRVVIADLAGDKLDAAIRGHDAKSVRLKKYSIMQSSKSIMIVQGSWPMCMRVCHAALLTAAY